MKERLENIGIPLKTVVIIVMALFTYGGSLATVYFTMKSKVDTATEIASETKDSVRSTNAKWDEIEKLLNKRKK